MTDVPRSVTEILQEPRAWTTGQLSRTLQALAWEYTAICCNARERSVHMTYADDEWMPRSSAVSMTYAQIGSDEPCKPGHQRAQAGRCCQVAVETASSLPSPAVARDSR
jgi:hypothetical protein